MNSKEIIQKARKAGKCIPAFNIPHIPMMEPIVQAVTDENSVAMIQVARVEWEKMQAGSLERIAEEYAKCGNPGYTLLHLDHIPVIDEDYRSVDYLSYLRRAIQAGFQSVMIDGSRLSLEENIQATAQAVQLAHDAGIPCEAELGAVMGHESAVLPPYKEIFEKRLGFTKPEEAQRFVRESGCDWLSVAVGNIHGAIAEAVRNQKKPEAMLDISHIAVLEAAAGVPLVLHGGSGVKRAFLLNAFHTGIAKMNVGTEMRQTYEFALAEKSGDVAYAQDALYRRVRIFLHTYLENGDLKTQLGV